MPWCRLCDPSALPLLASHFSERGRCIYRQSVGGCRTVWPSGPERSTNDQGALGSSADGSRPPCAITEHVASVCMIIRVYHKTQGLWATTKNIRVGFQSKIHPKHIGRRQARAPYLTQAPGRAEHSTNAGTLANTHIHTHIYSTKLQSTDLRATMTYDRTVPRSEENLASDTVPAHAGSRRQSATIPYITGNSKSSPSLSHSPVQVQHLHNLPPRDLRVMPGHKIDRYLGTQVQYRYR
jgi:hypothetical protein